MAASPLPLIPPQIFGFLVCMGVILAIGNAIWEHEVGMLFQVYLPWDEAVDSAFFSGFLSFWSYIIILNTVVPISLYVRYAALRGAGAALWPASLVREGDIFQNGRGGPFSRCECVMLFVYLCAQSWLHPSSRALGLCRTNTVFICHVFVAC